MKILQINKFFYRRGGADQHFLDLVELLQKEGNEVLVFSMKDKRNEKSADEKYFVNHREFGKFDLVSYLRPLKTVYSCEAKRKIEKLIKDKKPEIAHLHLIYHHLTPSILPILKKYKIPVVATIHDWKFICPNYSLFTQGRVCERCKGGKYYNCLTHRCLHGSLGKSALATTEAYFHHFKKYYEKYIDLYIAPSEFVKNKFIEFGYPAEKIVVLSHFLPANFISAEKDQNPVMPAHFAYVGRLSKEKGILDLCQKWLDEKVPYSLDIFGTGPLEKEIKKFCDKSAGKIICHGFVPREDIHRNYQQFTATISPSIVYETFGLSVLESLASGVPAVVNNLGALAEFAEKTPAVIAFDFKKPGSLLLALQQSAVSEKRSFAREFVKNYPSARNYYQKLISFYQGLL